MTAVLTTVETAAAPQGLLLLVEPAWAEFVCSHDDDCTHIVAADSRNAARRAAYDHLRAGHGLPMDTALALAITMVNAARSLPTRTAADFPLYDFSPTPQGQADQGRRTALAHVSALVNGSMTAAEFDIRSAECGASPERHFALAYADQVRALLPLVAR